MKKKRTNQGITLVELIVIMTIIAVFAGMLSYSIAPLSGFRARECNKKFASALAELKVTTLSKAPKTGEIKLYVYVKDGCYFMKTKGDRIEKEVQLSKRRVSITYDSDSGSNQELTGTEATPFEIYYNRSTGAIEKPSGLTKISATCGKTYSTDIIPTTGKVIIKNRKN